MATIKSKRNGLIEFLRFVFCLVIIIHHGHNLGGTPEIALFADAGYIGVEFFFIVSGFLMAMSATKNQQRNVCNTVGVETAWFIWGKIKPIIPAYIFAVIFSYGRMVIAEGYTFTEAVRNFMLGCWDLFFLRASGIRTIGLVRATWYLSAMFLAMLVLYPMLRKWKDSFTHIIAPAIVIFGLGYISQMYGNLNQYVNNWHGIYSGVVRALVELSLGCICYVVCEKIKKINFSVLSRIIISVVQLAGYMGVIYYTTDIPVEHFDFVMLISLAVCVTLSFSGQGICFSFFQNPVSFWLGKMSLLIYLNHMWVKDTIAWLLPETLGYHKLTLIYVLCVMTVSVICLIWTHVLEWLINKKGKQIQKLFIKAE